MLRVGFTDLLPLNSACSQLQELKRVGLSLPISSPPLGLDLEGERLAGRRAEMLYLLAMKDIEEFSRFVEADTEVGPKHKAKRHKAKESYEDTSLEAQQKRQISWL